MITGSPDESPARAIALAIYHTKKGKPNDRSEKDRAYAVTITKLEEAFAFFIAFAANDEIRRLLQIYQEAQAAQESTDNAHHP